MKNLENFYELIFENLLLEAPLTLKAILSAEKQPKLYAAAKKAYEKLMLSNMTEDPSQLKMIEDPNAEAMLNPELLSFKRKIFEISPTGVGFDFIFKILSRNDYQNTVENIKQLTILVDMGIRAVSFKKNIVFLNELIENMLLKQDQINQKEKAQVFFKKFDPTMSVFSKIENYYDLYENLKKYYESGNDNLINAFITMNVNNNLKLFLAKASFKGNNDVDLAAAAEGIFSNVRNEDFVNNIKKYFSGDPEEAKNSDSYMNQLTTFAGYYVPFINYCIENKIFLEIKPNKPNKDIKLFLIKTYDDAVCACNIYPKSFINSLNPKIATIISSAGGSESQFASHVDYDEFMMSRANALINVRGAAEWCIKSPDKYSAYTTSENYKYFLLILDNTVTPDLSKENGSGVYLTRIKINEDQKIATRATEFMDFDDKDTKIEDLSPALKEIYAELLKIDSARYNIEDDNSESCHENLYKKVEAAILGKNEEYPIPDISDANNIVQFKLDNKLNIDYSQKTQVILDENFLKNSDIIINDLKKINNLNFENMFEYIFKFIEKNILDNDQIRFFGLLLKKDELGVNINCFNISEMLMTEGFINFIQKIFNEIMPNSDFVLLNYLHSREFLIKFNKMINKIQKIYDERLEIEITQSINQENLLKIIDELYFMDYFKNRPEVIKKYFSINPQQKLLSFKQDLTDSIIFLNDKVKKQNDSTNIFSKIFKFKLSEYLEEKVGRGKNKKLLAVVSENSVDLIINKFNTLVTNNINPADKKIKTQQFLEYFNETLNNNMRYILSFENIEYYSGNINTIIAFIKNLLRFCNENKENLNSKRLKRLYGILENDGVEVIATSLEDVLNSNIITGNPQDYLKKLCVLKSMANFDNIQYYDVNLDNDHTNIKDKKLSAIINTINNNLSDILNIIYSFFGLFDTINRFFQDITAGKTEFIETLIQLIKSGRPDQYNYFAKTLFLNLGNNTENVNLQNATYLNNVDTDLNGIYYFIDTRLKSEIGNILKYLKNLNLNLRDISKILDLSNINIEDMIIDPELSKIVITQITQQTNKKNITTQNDNNQKQQDGFFKKMFKKWFFEGIEYQRINQNKILISETELKKLIKKNLLR